MYRRISNELIYYLKLGDAVVIMDEKQVILDVNIPYENMTGNKRQTIIGSTAEFLNSNLQPMMYKSFKDILKDGKPWSGIMVNIKKSSEVSYSFITITPIKIYEQIYYVGITRSVDQLAIEGNNQRKEEQKELYKVLALSSEIRDTGIAEHLLRVQRLTENFLLALNEQEKYSFPVAYRDKIIQYSILHDIGKSGVPESILYKPGPLTFYERKIIEMHPLIGVDVLYKISDGMTYKLFDDIAIASNIIKYHHEKWDGTGYPEGLKGEAIPFEARVIAIVDVYDALVSKRSYKESWSANEALSYLQEQRGLHFDPLLVDAFIETVIDFTMGEDKLFEIHC
ncbi:putative two-component system response regulator [Lysinibacillus parviboronicapiens]|uniref:Two-component system response regulator n=1 Tax=Lysinibacillus parviboronicapiens TaxID=436516 RepID=A0ABV2PEU7_9BACI